jgi:O-antigen/teichoic acid export membrane protein
VRILEALKILPGAFFGALLPMLAAGERPEVRRAYRRSFATLLGLSILLAALTAALARPLVIWLFGPAFAPAVVPLQIVSWSLPLTVVTFKLSFDLVARGLERVAGLSMLLTLLVAAPITYMLIVRWSLLGAAVALPLCEAAQILILASLTAVWRRA